MQDLNCQQTCKGKLLLEPYFRTSIITDHRVLQLRALMSQALSFLTQSLQLFLSAFGILLQSLVVKIVGPTGSGVGVGSDVGFGSGVGLGSGVDAWRRCPGSCNAGSPMTARAVGCPCVGQMVPSAIGGGGCRHDLH